jgi:hypothetical protein
MSNKRATRSNTSISYEENQQNLKQKLFDHDIVIEYAKDDKVIDEDDDDEVDVADDEFDDISTDDEDEEDVALRILDFKLKTQSLEIKKYKNVGNDKKRKFYMVELTSYITGKVYIKIGYTRTPLYAYIKSLTYKYKSESINLLGYCYIEDEQNEKLFHNLNRNYLANYSTDGGVTNHREVYDYCERIMDRYYEFVFSCNSIPINM